MNARHHDQKKYLILESCFLHKKNDLQVFEKDSSIKVLFLPPLTPMLNPTEYFFNEVKSMVKSRGYKTGTSYSELLQ
jgi:transposase